MLRNLCDTHVHTIFSRHAFSTVEEDVRAASERGLELLGIADHYSAMISSNVRPLDYQHFFCLHSIPREWMGVRVLRGMEADIVDVRGHLFGHGMKFNKMVTGDVWTSPFTLEEQALKEVDYVVASVHGRDFVRGASSAKVTQMYVGALEHPKVLMLGHIGRTGLPYELGPIVKAAAEGGKLLEINEHSFDFGKPGDARLEATYGRCRDLAIACAEAGVSIALNTDAHISVDIGRFDRALAMLEEIHFPEELLATRSADAFVCALGAAGMPFSEG